MVKSLLDEAADSPPAPDPRRVKAKGDLDQALRDFESSGDRGTEAFGRYCVTVTRVVDRLGLPEGPRARLVGRYVDAAAESKRGGGRAPSPEVPLLDFLRHEINRERGASSLEQSIAMRIPAKEIAEIALNDWKLNLTPEQIRKRLARIGRK